MRYRYVNVPVIIYMLTQFLWNNISMLHYLAQELRQFRLVPSIRHIPKFDVIYTSISSYKKWIAISLRHDIVCMDGPISSILFF